MITLFQRKQLKKIAIIVTAMVLVAIAASQGWIEHIADREWVASYLQKGGLFALACLSGIGILYTAVGGPRQILAFVLGYAYGGWIGIILSTLITGVGAALCFILARSLAADTLHRRFGPRLERLQKVLENHTAMKVLMIRLLPVGSNLITNVLAGATNIRILPFLAGSVIGYIPQMAVFGLLGAGIGVSDHEQLILSIVLFVAASLIGLFLYRTRYNRSVSELVTKGGAEDQETTEQSRQI